MNATSTQMLLASGPASGLAAKVSTKNTGSNRPPSTMKRRRDPVSARLRSLRPPMTGSMTTSHSFATPMMMDAPSAAIPSVSVR